TTMNGRLLLISFLSTLTSTSIISRSPSKPDCLDTYIKCHHEMDEQTIYYMNTNQENVFHYCENTRTKLIPCMAKHLNMSVGPTAYDRGAFLHSCPYHSSEYRKKEMTQEGKQFLVACVYNDIRNMQNRECYRHMDVMCGPTRNVSIANCHNISPCPRFSTAPFPKQIVYASASGTYERRVFKTGKRTPNSSTTVSLSVVSLLIALLIQ
ncbi:hypothetical protein PFISCL1PPCAC_14673, partial [Pristionchus fissidentatus]